MKASFDCEVCGVDTPFDYGLRIGATRVSYPSHVNMDMRPLDNAVDNLTFRDHMVCCDCAGDALAVLDEYYSK